MVIKHLMGPALPYLAIAALGAALLAVSALQVQTNRLGAVRAENAALRLQVDACNARISNIKKDAESDAQIDNLSDDDLRNAPDGWMLPPGAGGIY